MNKIIETIFLIIILGVVLLPFWIFLSLFHFDMECLGYGKIKDLVAVDRGFYIYELENGTRWSKQYNSTYQNGETVCLQEKGTVKIYWKPFTFKD